MNIRISPKLEELVVHLYNNEIPLNEIREKTGAKNNKIYYILRKRGILSQLQRKKITHTLKAEIREYVGKTPQYTHEEVAELFNVTEKDVSDSIGGDNYKRRLERSKYTKLIRDDKGNIIKKIELIPDEV